MSDEAHVSALRLGYFDEANSDAIASAGGDREGEQERGVSAASGGPAISDDEIASSYDEIVRSDDEIASSDEEIASSDDEMEIYDVVSTPLGDLVFINEDDDFDLGPPRANGTAARNESSEGEVQRAEPKGARRL